MATLLKQTLITNIIPATAAYSNDNAIIPAYLNEDLQEDTP